MEYVVQVIVVTVALTVLGGVSQAMPWGLGSARQLRQRTDGHEGDEFGPKGDSIIDVSSSPIVTESFEQYAANQVSTLTTDHSFSWIVNKPIDYYRPGRYLGIEVATQLLVAVCIVAIHALLDDTTQGTTILVVFLAAVATAIATYGQLANWWGLTWRYTAGVSLTLIIAWTLSITLITTIWP